MNIVSDILIFLKSLSWCPFNTWKDYGTPHMCRVTLITYFKHLILSFCLIIHILVLKETVINFGPWITWIRCCTCVFCYFIIYIFQCCFASHHSVWLLALSRLILFMDQFNKMNSFYWQLGECYFLTIRLYCWNLSLKCYSLVKAVPYSS